MTQINTVIIYEFRSGFTHQSCGNSWRSTGFYGPPYIGNSFHDGFIPEPLQRATRREDSRFDVSQKIDYQNFINLPHQSRDSIGFKKFNEDFVDENALVGRIIEGWAVLAVVSVAIDFGNRPFPVKRYFCCRESYDGNYDAMATLIKFFFEKGPENLTFDTLENKPKKSYKVNPLSYQDLQSLNLLDYYDSVFDGLCLIKPDLNMRQDYLLQMWTTCLSLVGGDRKKAAWAFNVDSVANFTDFTLIKAETQEFFQRNSSRIFPQLVPAPSPYNKRELSNSNYSSQQVSSPSQFNQGRTSSNSDHNSIFNNFVENEKLPQQEIYLFQFITEGIKQKNQLWQNLANKKTEEIQQLNDYSCIIRYYTLSALIVPERSVDLFKQLLVSEDNIWAVFLSYTKYFKSFQKAKNDPGLKQSIEEGVWLIINDIIEGNIIEGGFRLPNKKSFQLPQYVKLGRFFCEENNIWRQGIVWSFEKLCLTESSDTVQQQENTSSSFQIFQNNLHDEKCRNNNIKGYQQITQIFSKISENPSIYKNEKTGFLFFQALIKQKINGQVSHRVYSHLSQYLRNDLLLSNYGLEKQKTIWENLCSILNNIPPRKERQQKPQQLSSMNSQQTNRNPVDNVHRNTQHQITQNNSGNGGQINNCKKVLSQFSIMLAVFALLCIIATIILGLLQLPMEVVMSTMAVAILLIVIAFFMFILQELI